MKCCSQCQGLEEMFDSTEAARDLRAYRRSGPARSTRRLLDALREAGVDGLTLLDIGGGVGAIQHELFKSGVRAATDVDASSAYLAASREEAARQGHADRTQYFHGNFVDLAPQIEEADIVTLDRVICCYPDMPALVGLSSAKARRLYGVVYPRDVWWTRLGRIAVNLYSRMQRSQFRFFVHPSAEVDATVRRNGLTPRFKRQGLFWQVVVYGRG
jgi:magnesium-protoporphyrin O-methyltransferase